jgi:hypothetical protein
MTPMVQNSNHLLADLKLLGEVSYLLLNVVLFDTIKWLVIKIGNAHIPFVQVINTFLNGSDWFVV